MERPIPVERLDGLLRARRGLTAEEVASRRQRYGPNHIVEKPAGGWRDLLRDTARDPMLWFLVGTGVLFATLGDFVEAATLFFALLPLVGMDLYLHRRTMASTEGLATRLAATAVVLRDGETKTVPAADLVPGDLMEVTAGTIVPADGLIVGGKDLQADESTLTGEALPARKRPHAQASITAARVPDRHWVFAGTRLLTGQARVRVAYTGGETLYGEIVRSAERTAHVRTPMQAAIGSLVGVLVTAALIMCVILAAIRLRQGHGWLDAALSAVTLAVAALPEEFPVVFTFFLGVGVYRLARRQALAKRALAVENIGRVTCICSDKTGTLTEGRLALTHRLPADGQSAEDLVRFAALASRRESGDPLDAALLDAAPFQERDGRGDALAVFPFTEDRRRETVVWREDRGTCIAVTKGAPETILAISILAEPERAAWLERLEEYTGSGHKVIACAVRSLPEGIWSGGEPDRGFILVGVLALEDPVREGAPEAIRTCLKAGIRVIMITGDHPSTAAAIAREVGLGDGHPKVAVMPDSGEPTCGNGAAPWRDADVVARAFPSQKLAIVRSLQETGEIVAVTGDGVNDVPALQAADIGIAMGERGTRSAQEAADIVLLDDNFRTIVRAIAEGRQLFRNLQLSFAYLLVVHIPLVLSAAIIPLAGYPLLYLPIHIVWLELVIHPTALLVFQELPTGKDLLPAGRERPQQFFGLAAWLAIGLVGALITAVIVIGYDYALGSGRDVEHARAMAIVALLCASATTTVALSGLRTRAAMAVILCIFASTALFVQVPAAAALLHLSPLHSDDWAIGIGAGALAGGLSLLVPLALGRQRSDGSAVQASSGA